MDREQVIRMARDADCGHESIDLRWISPENLERFAALIEAAATEKANERANTSWALMCEKMVKAEREAFAKVCEDSVTGFSLLVDLAKNIADEMNKKEGTK